HPAFRGVTGERIAYGVHCDRIRLPELENGLPLHFRGRVTQLSQALSGPELDDPVSVKRAEQERKTGDDRIEVVLASSERFLGTFLFRDVLEQRDAESGPPCMVSSNADRNPGPDELSALMKVPLLQN